MTVNMVVPTSGSLDLIAEFILFQWFKRFLDRIYRIKGISQLKNPEYPVDPV